MADDATGRVVTEAMARHEEVEQRIARDADALRDELAVTIVAIRVDPEYVHVRAEPLPEGVGDLLRSRYGPMVRTWPAAEPEGCFGYDPGPGVVPGR